MTCPHLEETSARFDRGEAPHDCDECRAFVADAMELREAMRGMSFSVPASRRAEARRHVFAGVFVIALCLILFAVLRPQKSNDSDSPFSGLDGGGRAVITVKE